jgi:soluble lytic murein transglycosylase-like protein
LKTEAPPQLPNTRLSRSWIPSLRTEAEQRRARRFRVRRVELAIAVVALFLTGAAIAVATQTGGGGVTVHHVAAPQLPAFVTGSARRALGPAFTRAAAESHLPAALVMALAWRESEWDNGQVSPAGAAGIGQLLPPTSTFVATELLHEPHLDPRRAQDNIRLCARYLRELISGLGGNQRLGIGAYLQGSTSVRSQGLTLETIAYVNQIEDLQTQFARALGRH